MKIIAYNWEGDVACVGCTQARFSNPIELAKADPAATRDANGIALSQKDAQGNFVHPVYDTDYFQPPNCGTCREALQ